MLLLPKSDILVFGFSFSISTFTRRKNYHTIKKQTQRKNQKYKTETKLHPTFTLVKYDCRGILHIQSMCNILSQKTKLSSF